MSLVRQFQQYVLPPFERLLESVVARTLEDANMSRTVLLAQEAASHAYHFTEHFGRNFTWDNADAEVLRQKLCDVTDTMKHKVLRKPDRQITVTGHACFEFREDKMLRYLGKSVQAQNLRFGQFSLVGAIGSYLPFLAAKCGLGLEAPELPPLSPFVQYEQLEIQSRVGLETFGFKLVTRNDSGELIPTDHGHTIRLLAYNPPQGERLGLLYFNLQTDGIEHYKLPSHLGVDA